MEQLSQIERIKRKFKGNFFNEFVLEFSNGWPNVDSFLKEKGVIGGLSLEEHYPELENCVLVCVTEKQKKEEIDRLVELIKETI